MKILQQENSVPFLININYGRTSNFQTLFTVLQDSKKRVKTYQK